MKIDNQQKNRCIYENTCNTRLAYHVPSLNVPLTTRNSPIGLLRPCAEYCTTWNDATTAFEALGHGGSVLCKRDDGKMQFVGTMHHLKQWWNEYGHTQSHSVVIEENLWSRHPHAKMNCLRYVYCSKDHGSIHRLERHISSSQSSLLASVSYKWHKSKSDTNCIKAIQTLTRDFVRRYTNTLPPKAALDLCWFPEANRVYIVDCIVA